MSACAQHGAATTVTCCLDKLVTFFHLRAWRAVVPLGSEGAAAPAFWSQSHKRMRFDVL
jgi:hypothetical protein